MLFCAIIFLFQQKTAYEMRISDWSSDVCSSDLPVVRPSRRARRRRRRRAASRGLKLTSQNRIEREHWHGTCFRLGRDTHGCRQRRRQGRSLEERRVGQWCVRTRSSRWSPYPYKTKDVLCHLNKH